MACDICGSDTHPLQGYCPQDEKNWNTVQMAPQGLVDKETERQLKLYEKAKFEGNQPWGTGMRHGSKYTESEYAMAMADHLGRPYRAEDMGSTFYPEVAKELKPLSEEAKAQARSEAS